MLVALAMALTASAAPDSTQLVPGGVVDEAGRIAYVHGASGGIDAIDLPTGKTRWSDTTAERPLAIVGDHLLVEIVRPDGVHLSVREARPHGRRVVAGVPIPLPPWVHGDAGRTVVFSSAVEPAGQRGVVRYRWSAERRWSGMHRPRGRPGAEGERESEEASGELLVHIATAKTEPASNGGFPSLPYLTEQGTSRRAWQVDGVWCAFTSEPRDYTPWLFVRCVRSDGSPLPVVPIAPSPMSPRLSTDGRLVAVAMGSGPARSVRLPAGEAGPSLPSTLGATFVVVGSLVLIGSPAHETAAGVSTNRQLRAMSTDGVLRWTHPLYTPPWRAPRQ